MRALAHDADFGATRIPKFVLDELEGYLGCGLLSRGLSLHAQASGCATEGSIQDEPDALAAAYGCH